MYAALSPGAVGVSFPDLFSKIEGTARHGFGGVEIDPNEVIANGSDAVNAAFERAGIKPAAWGMPVDWRSTEENWKAGLEKLPALAAAAKSVGCFRTCTWIMPASNDRELAENRAFHIDRFKPIAEILGEHGHRLGLEFIGPKTLRDQFKYPFLYEIQDMLTMAKEIGSNVGLLVDAYHWYTLHARVTDLEKLEEKDVVYVHVNDAPVGIAVDEQQDGTRDLPGATGVIDIAGFLGALKRVGYTGPVTPEPFKKDLADLPNNDARLEATAASMRKILATV